MGTVTTPSETETELKIETLEEITLIVGSIVSDSPLSVEAMNTQLRRIAEHGGLVFSKVVDLVYEQVSRRVGTGGHPSLRNNQTYQALVRFRNK